MAEIRAFSSPFRKKGTGRPSMAPMATYIRGTRMHREAMSRVFIARCSRSASSWRFCHWPRKLFSPGFPAAGLAGSAP